MFRVLGINNFEVRKKSGFSFFEGVFLNFLLVRKLKFLKKYFSNRTKKLHKKAFMIFFLIFFCPQKDKINPECNTARSFKESLYIALGH